MLRLVWFEPDHISVLRPQETQKPGLRWMSRDIAEAAAQWFALTAIDPAGEIVACAGIAPTEQRPVAWAVFGQNFHRYRLSLFRIIGRALDLYGGEPIEAHIRPEHDKAADFARRLHFRFEQARADLSPDGAVLHVYVRTGR